MGNNNYHPRIKDSEWKLMHSPREQESQEEMEQEEVPIWEQVKFEIWYRWEMWKLDRE